MRFLLGRSFIAALLAVCAWPLDMSAQSAEDYYSLAMDSERQKQFETAFSHYEKSCSGGHSPGCMGAARMLADGEGVARNQSRGRAYFETACSLGNSVGCNWAGDMMLKGEGGPIDVARARTFYLSGCDRGQAASCVEAGELMELGKGGPKDISQALMLYQKGCADGYARGCNLAGVVVKSEEGGKDEVAARRYFDQACLGGYHNGCANFGQYLEKGIGGGKDAARARQIYQSGCSGFIMNTLSCYRLGAILLTEDGGPRDAYEGAVALERVCTSEASGDERLKANACFTLGKLFSVEFTEADPTLAPHFFSKACDHGYQGEACGD